MSEANGGIDFWHPPTSTDPDMLFSILEAQVSSYLTGEQDRDLLARAYALAAQAHRGMRRDSGVEYVTHPLHVALILSHLQLDAQTLAAALLHDVLEDTQVTYEELEAEFGPEVAVLVEGVTKLTQVSRTSKAGQGAANVQKVYLAMSEDLRVIFIKLADRLHNLRTLHFRQDPQSRQRTATEALEVYARIADRLGIAILRKEIEDLAFSYLDPSEYERIKRSIERRYLENAEQVQVIQRQILEMLHSRQIQTVGDGIHANPRRVYDMYRRMQEELHPSPGKPKRVPPQLRFHVLVQDIPSCYLAMAEIHARWTPIASETRDYISAPLPNGYQSLHTTVFIDQQPVKFQIRTMWMHRASQLGIIAYMQDENWTAAGRALQQTVDDLRQFGLEAIRDLSGPVEFLTSLKREILGDEIYVYTPKNKVIKLSVGSTPVDFAYQIHTDVGHSCRGALVDGRWVALNRPLRTGERVEILTLDSAGPRFEWLDPNLEYTNSPLAKGKIRRWFRRRPHRAKVELGRRQLHRILDRLSLPVEDLSALTKRMGYQDEQAMFVDIGGCDLALERVLSELLQVYGEQMLPQICQNGTSAIPVTGTGSLGKSFALCCRPQPGDDIVGYILASSRVVEVHRSSCEVLLSKMEKDPSRFVPVKWGRTCETYAACMEIYAYDRPFLLRDVWNIISDEDINVSDVNVQVNRTQDALVTICIDVENWLQFNRVLTRIEDLPGTIRVRRRVMEGVEGSHL
jgi:guanosine-3',5'-bis(diphosphate) 3'-pyrophosphohydrolase